MHIDSVVSIYALCLSVSRPHVCNHVSLRGVRMQAGYMLNGCLQ